VHSGDEYLIPVFDSAKDDTRIEHWVERVDCLTKPYQWYDNMIIRLIASRLKGSACQWYDEQTTSDFLHQSHMVCPKSKTL
jgi:hypothetical protein